MTVSEFIEKLKEYDGGLQVFGSSEGCFYGFSADDFIVIGRRLYISTDDEGCGKDHFIEIATNDEKRYCNEN